MTRSKTKKFRVMNESKTNTWQCSCPIKNTKTIYINSTRIIILWTFATMKETNCYRTNSLKQLRGRHVAPLSHSFLDSESTGQCLLFIFNAASLAENRQITIL